MLFHRGMIEGCLGNEEGERKFLEQALELNPNFSLLHVPIAEELVT
jgi:hypothetical protein